MDKVVSDTVNLFERIPLRKGPDESNELPEGLTIVLIEYNGADPARLVNAPPNLGHSADWRYENFLRRMCERYSERFT